MDVNPRPVLPTGHAHFCSRHQDTTEPARLLADAITFKTVTDDFYINHYDYITCVADELERLDINTRTAYAVRSAKHDWLYDANRVAIHEEIIAEEMARWVTVPKNRYAILTGGLIGSGKTSTLRHHSTVDLDQFILLSADVMKLRFADKGLVPHMDGFTPLEASILSYKETNHVVWTLFEKAVAGGWNLIFDTMMGTLEATMGKITPMHEAGYVIDGLFVDVSIETAIRRTQQRHRMGLTKYVLEGKGHGGRLLPLNSITEQATVKGSKYRSINREVFTNLTAEGYFAEVAVYANDIDGQQPLRVI